ncbi:ATP-grasp domain-containing protein [Streptomyces sp. NBC_01198]|uniref:ATP-grasp domain-containing protein n=1 Tax=Streptomyces sp. NBC_01198 TaxID=2903769 RepID=UPI002E1508D4|nr:ATP-grasp domain-containing protein [Streptomyces sp. NBC_01198]
MQMYLLALNPTDSVTEGFLPAARRLGLTVTVLTDQPDAHRAVAGDAYDGVEVLECPVRDFRAVVARISAHRRPGIVFSNSDHLQVQTALAAAYFGLPAKDWRVALRTKDKAEMRRRLAAAGLPAGTAVHAVELPAGQDPATARDQQDIRYPSVLKPREGVASEDVVLVRDRAELAARWAEISARRPGDALVVEEFLPGDLCTLETVGDGTTRRVLGGFRTRLSPPPYFIEERLTWDPDLPAPVVAQVLAQLDALGVGFGACHTEFVLDRGRARLVEVNYRAIGDQCDLLLADLLQVPLFELVLRVHLGEPLPPGPWPASRRAACLAYPYAREAGTLTAAPAAEDLELDGVRLAYRPLRAVGSHRPLHHTNRDLLGVVRASGPDQQAVDRTVDAFVAARTWEITA